MVLSRTMENYAKSCKSTVIPGLRYQNASGTIQWLCGTFGFRKQALYSASDGTVMHAQLTFGNGIIMIGSVGTDKSILVKQPDEIGGAETQPTCLVVSDCDALHARAKSAGASILIDPEEKEYGGNSFACNDPEGHIRHIGTYDPWEVQGA